MSRPLFVKINNAWKQGTPYIKVGGTWKQISEIDVKQNGTWGGTSSEHIHQWSPLAVSSWSLDCKQCTLKDYCYGCGHVNSSSAKVLTNIQTRTVSTDSTRYEHYVTYNGKTYVCSGWHKYSTPSHTHSYIIAATCTSPKMCSCGATSGTALGHDWNAATCDSPKTCNRCRVTEGSALGHSYSFTKTVPSTCTIDGYDVYTCSKCGGTKHESNGDTACHQYTAATCTAPKTCSVCGYTVGEPLGHSWKSATCKAPKTCSRCGVTEGLRNPNAHVYGGDTTCDLCGYKAIGCVFAGTQIALDEDTSIDIADFMGGNSIDFCNPDTLEHSSQQTLTKFFYPKATDKVVVTLEDGKTLAMTPNHVVLTNEGFKIYLDNQEFPKYQVGDSLATIDGYKAITSIQEETVEETTVYNIAAENNLMVANGIIVAGELNHNVDSVSAVTEKQKPLN